MSFFRSSTPYLSIQTFLCYGNRHQSSKAVCAMRTLTGDGIYIAEVASGANIVIIGNKFSLHLE